MLILRSHFFFVNIFSFCRLYSKKTNFFIYFHYLHLFFFYFLDIRVRAAVISLPGHVGTVLAVGLTMFYLVDFIHCFRLRMGGMEEEEPVIGRLKVY